MLVKTSISTTRFLVYLQVYGKKLSKYGTYEDVRASEYKRISSFRPLPVLDISALVTDDVGEVERVSGSDSGSLEEERSRLDAYLGSVSSSRGRGYTLPDGSLVELVDYVDSEVESLPMSTNEVDLDSLSDEELESRIVSLFRLAGLLDSSYGSSSGDDSEGYSDGYDEEDDSDSDSGTDSDSSGEWASVSESEGSYGGDSSVASSSGSVGSSASASSEGSVSSEGSSSSASSEGSVSSSASSESSVSSSASASSESETTSETTSETSSETTSGTSSESSLVNSEDLGLVTGEDEYEFPTYSVLLSSIFNDASKYSPVSHDLYYKRKVKDKVSVAKFGSDVKPNVEPPKPVSGDRVSSSSDRSPTERLEHEDIVSYLRRLVRVKESVALVYFSPREIEASLSLGKIVRRHGTLIFSHS